MTAGAPRWAVSFADLGLLLLGCFVLLHAMEAQRPKADAARVTPGVALPRGETIAAASLFEPGEARLTEVGRTRLAALARRLAGGGVAVTGQGTGEGGARLDRVELAAARTAAAARALRDGGVAENAIIVRLDSAPGGASGQTILIARR